MSLERLRQLTERLCIPAKILIVEDEGEVRDVLASIVRAEGYEPITASNGKDALQIMDEHDIRLVLLDLVMPIMDGIEFLKSIDGRVPVVPVIIVTGNYDHEFLGRIVERFGLVCFVSKPFDPFVIRKLVNLFNLTKRKDCDGAAGK